MMMRHFTAQMFRAEQVTPVAGGKKSSKRFAGVSSLELFSQPAQQNKSNAKMSVMAFKKILEPKKQAVDTLSVQVQASSQKKSRISDVSPHTVPLAWRHTPVPIQIVDAKSLPAPALSKKQQPTISKLPNPNIRPTIDPRSPMHDVALGNKDSGRTLITDGPKTKVNDSVAKTAADTALAKPQSELKLTSDKYAAKRTVGQAAGISAQNELFQVSPLKELAAQYPDCASKPSETGVKAHVSNETPTSAEKVRVSHRTQASDGSFKGISEMDNKQKKYSHIRQEIVHHKEPSASDGLDVANPTPLKNNENVEAVLPEQILQLMASDGKKAQAPIGNNSVASSSITSHAGINVNEQIASIVRNASDKIGQKVTVTLNPPELGKISIRLAKNGDEVSGRLEVERLGTKSQIDLNLPQIIQNLQDAGVQLRRVEVVLQDQFIDGGQEFAGQAQSDWSQKREFEPGKGGSDIHSLISADIQPLHTTEPYGHLSDRSINILV